MPTEPWLVPCCDAMTRTEALHAVAVGTEPSHTPVQTTALLNTGLGTLTYTVDVIQDGPDGAPSADALARAQNGGNHRGSTDSHNHRRNSSYDSAASPGGNGGSGDNASGEGEGTSWGFKWLHLENPTGAIEPRGAVALRWRFMPVQPREYAATLLVRYVGGAHGAPVERVERIRLTAKGYDPRAEDPHAVPPPPISAGLTPPPYQLVPVAAQIASLSRDRPVTRTVCCFYACLPACLPGGG
jgi:hypothetical protein